MAEGGTVRDMFPAAILALIALSEADSPMLLWLIIGGLMALGPVIHSYIKVYEWFRGKSIDTSDFVTRTELAAMKQERDAQIAATVAQLRTDFAEIKKFMVEDLPAIHRALGRLEGHDEAEEKGRRRPR